jgi:hypothetical protein
MNLDAFRSEMRQSMQRPGFLSVREDFSKPRIKPDVPTFLDDLLRFGAWIFNIAALATVASCGAFPVGFFLL